MSDSPHSSDISREITREQVFVDNAYRHLDDLRDTYRQRQARVHANHGVGNAQGWTERDAISAHYGNMAARLDGVEDRLVFGRLDDMEGKQRYIGRTSLSEEDGTSLLIDWRAPAAAPFYRATPIDRQGIVRRRHILTRARTVLGIEDDVLDAQAASESGLELQGEGALMAALGKARDGFMGDIVATIQAEQDHIIRAQSNGLIVVQGGPGTGKTAVALHRIAYLLHAERERLERSGVLLVGPSRVFLRYIEKVLPSLGETGVVSLTVGDLVPGIKARGVELPDVAYIKGLSAWTQILHRAVRTLVQIPPHDEVLDVWNRRVTLRQDDVVRAAKYARRGGRPHNVARDVFALELMKVLARRLITEAAGIPESSDIDSEEFTLWLQEIRDSVSARRAINRAWMPTSSLTLLERLWAKPALLARLNDEVGSPLSPEQLTQLARPRTSPITVADIPLLDELEELLGPLPSCAASRSSAHDDEATQVERAREAMEALGLGGGIVSAEMLAESVAGAAEFTPLAERAARDRTWTYGHIVVDEAQDLSAMAWRSLLRRCPARSFTVVGDLDQRRGNHRIASWSEALGPAVRALTDEFVLSVSYRTPRTLTDVAERVLARAGMPVIHPMQAVRDVDDCLHIVDARDEFPMHDDDEALRMSVAAVLRHVCEVLDQRQGRDYGRVAVLLSADRARAWGGDTVGMSTLTERVSVLSASASKGLEFDSVIVVEPSEILHDGPGDLFVALTRATYDLTVVHCQSLPAGMDEWE
ncbi:HelD family protein [Schaalia sp. lx-100]|uniref:HelD family protein n=1 Tax=Schaalia sp. lx-100 TaxID=2899081 RepID=UPI001E5283DF|nr:AAA family ATPase [Schaalia sp. lx-100]